jgi:hypothetical protein
MTQNEHARRVLEEHAGLTIEHNRDAEAGQIDHVAYMRLDGTRFALMINSDDGDQEAAERHLVECCAGMISRLHVQTKRILDAAGVVMVSP